MADPEERIEGLRYAKKALSDADFIDADIEQTERDLELLSGMIRNCIHRHTNRSRIPAAVRRTDPTI